VRIFRSSVVSCLLVTPAILFLTGCGGSSSPPSTGGGQQDGTVVIAASPSQIGAGANYQFTATVVGISGSQGVNWAVPTVSGGTIDSTGLYISPSTGTFPVSVTVTATSQADSTVTASASLTITPTDPLGTAQGAVIACPTFSGGLPNSSSTCYQVNTSCPGVADFSAYLKVNQPTATPLGTVLFGTGSGGDALYDNDPPDFFNGSTNGGLAVVQSVLDAGYTTVQITFKISNLRQSSGPLSSDCLVFGMSDIQFCNAQERAAKAKADDWKSVSVGEGGIFWGSGV
jgi:hypothetical protein